MNAAGAAHHLKGLVGLVLVLAGAQGWAAAAASDQEARALAAIQAREYELSWQADRGAWQAPNRAQNLRTYFTDAGIRVVPRLEQDPEQPSWEWGLSLVRYGRAGVAGKAALGAARRLAPQGNRLDRDWGASGTQRRALRRGARGAVHAAELGRQLHQCDRRVQRQRRDGHVHDRVRDFRSGRCLLLPGAPVGGLLCPGHLQLRRRFPGRLARRGDRGLAGRVSVGDRHQ